MIRKVVKKGSLHDPSIQGADLNYWLARSPSERIEAVEIRSHKGSAGLGPGAGEGQLPVQYRSLLPLRRHGGQGGALIGAKLDFTAGVRPDLLPEARQSAGASTVPSSRSRSPSWASPDPPRCRRSREGKDGEAILQVGDVPNGRSSCGPAPAPGTVRGRGR